MADLMPYVWGAVIWILWTGFIVLAGSDLGIGALLLAAKRTEKETYLQSIGPMWGGNQVWFVTAAGATFAAFPVWYATLFSGTVVPLMILVCALVLRGVAIEWGGRSSAKSKRWQGWWQGVHVASSAAALAVLGVIFSALIRGMELAVVNPATLAQADAKGINPFAPVGASYRGFVHYNLAGPFQSFSWYSVFGALAFLFPLLLQGALFLAVRSQGQVRIGRHAQRILQVLSLVFVSAWLILGTAIFNLHPLMIALCWAIYFLAGVSSFWLDQNNRRLGAWIANSVSLTALTTAGLFGHYPYLLYSLVDERFSLTLINSASTSTTLVFMTIVGVVVIPLVLVYTTWGYWITRKVADPRQRRTSLPFDEVLMK